MKTISDELFNELKSEAIKIWQTYDNSYGYADEKIAYLNSFGNVGDNYGTIIGMFDVQNQLKLYKAVGTDARVLIDDWVGGSLNEQYTSAMQMGLFGEDER